jgi:hypothetical protein
MNKIPFFSLIILIMLFGCKPKENITEINTIKDHPFEFLDSIAASNAIITDNTDQYFEKVTVLDMSIQMKRPVNGLEDRSQILEYYRSFLQTEVLNFTEQEKTSLKKVMIRALNLCNSLSPELVPGPVKLIKTKGNHYGAGAFYTREKCIIIPQSDLTFFDEERMLGTLLHELSHIITRYSPQLQDDLYQTIGFEKLIPDETKLTIPEPLKIKLLSNPDGLDKNHAIRLVKPNGKLIWALPLTYSSYKNYTADIPVFFGYLQFQLFELETSESGTFKVLTKPDGQSTLHLQNFPGFFEKITDNTEYIIHPDEIIADNFYLMIFASNNIAGLSRNNFSKEGQALMKKIKTVIMKR